MANVPVGLGIAGQPEMQEKGVIAARFRISLSATTSVGDVLQIGKLPHGAQPLDVVFYPGAAFAAGIYKFGWSASQAAFLASQTYSVFARGNVNLGDTQISLSDDAPVRYEYVTLVPAAAVSVGHFGNLVVFYRMPGQTE